mmetsp:Transcript_16185/g.27947  ORF Transcript_16185/g.27947 Transcript_16185/m.27947 type:complete len:294 (+) Transcript_16185:834-1715(+)
MASMSSEDTTERCVRLCLCAEGSGHRARAEVQCRGGAARCRLGEGVFPVLPAALAGALGNLPALLTFTLRVTIGGELVVVVRDAVVRHGRVLGLVLPLGRPSARSCLLRLRLRLLRRLIGSGRGRPLCPTGRLLALGRLGRGAEEGEDDEDDDAGEGGADHQHRVLLHVPLRDLAVRHGLLLQRPCIFQLKLFVGLAVVLDRLLRLALLRFLDAVLRGLLHLPGLLGELLGGLGVVSDQNVVKRDAVVHRPQLERDRVHRREVGRVRVVEVVGVGDLLRLPLALVRGVGDHRR